MDDTQRTGWQKRILLFLTSQCITLFGSTLVQMALVWYATMQTSSGVWVAAFTVCSYLPQFLISFIGGVWADRYHRKKLIIGADLLIAFVTFVMVLAIFHRSLLCSAVCLLCRSYDPWGQEYKLQQSMPLSHSLSRKISLCGTTASMQQCSLLLILRLQRRQVQFLQSAH